MANFHLTGMPAHMMFAGLGLPLLPTDNTYKAIINPNHQKSVIGSVITLDGRASTTASGPPLAYFWAFKEYPIGSQVDKYLFSSSELDDSIVNFSPDVPGFYQIELIVGDNNALSPPGYSEALITILMVPHNQGLVPDASFIWRYLGDFWDIYADKDKFTTIWSSTIQIVANELLSAYQIDYNKSIRDIQDYFQKKWLSYNPKLDLDNLTTFIPADDQAGDDAATFLLNVIAQPTYSNIVTIVAPDGSFTKTTYNKPISKGRVLKIANASYTMLRSTDIGNSSAFFATKNTIKTGRVGLKWRFSSTLNHPLINFEKMGVSPGDVLVLDISKLNTNLTSEIQLQIVSVDEFNIGFVFNNETLTDGVPATGLSKNDQLRLAKDLKIEGLSTNVNGDLIYTDQALAIKTIIESIEFKRKYYEESLSPSSTITIGSFAFQIKPKYIIRNTKIEIDTKIASVPTLQEYIKQPELVRNNNTLSINLNGKIYNIDKEPYVLFENSDYIIDDDKSIEVNCDLTANSDTIVILYGDLLDRDIRENDTLVISVGFNSNTYTIKEVVDQERIKVYPIPIKTERFRLGKLIRRIPGKYIRFVKNAFSHKNMAPHSLWGEVTYLDNSEIIEKNFGTLVGLTKERKDKQGIKAPYRATIAGLMYTYSRGPTIYNLKLGAQILLGLPFTYHRGIIIDINPEYRLNPTDLSPLYGRILIEERDKNNKPTGLVDVYLYPRGKQIKINGKWEDQDPDFSGLGINLKTNKTFAEGDYVDRFTILSKGVEISDYLSDPVWYNDVIISSAPEEQIKKYHTAYLRANIDSYGTADFDFVGSYVRKTKPHYVDLKALALKSFSDDIIIQDDLFFKPIYTFFESIGLSFPNAVKFDDYYVTPEYMTIEGVMYTRYIYGNDLVTTYNSNNVSSQAGGFINQRTNEVHDSPYIRADDVLVINTDINKGKYLVSTVVDDKTVTVINAGKFATRANQNFTIYRPIKNPIFRGTITVTQGIDTCTFSPGVLSAGVAVDDIVIIDTSNPAPIISNKYTVIQIASSNSAKIYPIVSESSGTYPCLIYREEILQKHLLAPSEAAFPFAINTTNNDPWIAFDINNAVLLGAIKIKDTIYIQGHPPYLILDFDPLTLRAYVTPTPTVTNANFAKVWRTYLPSNNMSVDIGERLIIDPLELELKDQVGKAFQTANSSTVDLVGAGSPIFLNIKPGDFFRFLSKSNSGVDIGYGNGIFPIAQIPNNGTSIILTRPVPNTEDEVLYSYIRKLR